MPFRLIIGTSQSNGFKNMKTFKIIKAVEIGDAEFQITLPTGGNVNVTAREDVPPGKARVTYGGGKISCDLSLHRALAMCQTAELVLMNADDLTELLNSLSYDELQLMS
jgi:hypothetical protein